MVQARSWRLRAITDIGDPTLVATILSNLGMTYDADPAQAIAYQEQALALVRPLDIPPTQALILNNYAHAALVANQLDLAERLLNEAIATLEQLRANLNERQQVAIFQTQERTYNLLQQVLVARNRPAAAIEIAEWGRARTFANLLARHSIAANTVPQLVTGSAPGVKFNSQGGPRTTGHPCGIFARPRRSPAGRSHRRRCYRPTHLDCATE